MSLKLEQHKAALAADLRAVAVTKGIRPNRVEDLWALLTTVCEDRAYDDAWHELRAQPRILPYDGRDYCFLYADGADDRHVRSLLAAIYAEWPTSVRIQRAVLCERADDTTLIYRRARPRASLQQLTAVRKCKLPPLGQDFTLSAVHYLPAALGGGIDVLSAAWYTRKHVAIIVEYEV